MPFTFAHPALVLPFVNRNWKMVSATGLIVGSIIPDFESFIRFDEHKLYSHTLPGIFWFDLPVAILVTFLFHNLVRDPLIRNLPFPLERRFAQFMGFNWNGFFRKHFIVVVCSVLVGIGSHLLWDAATQFNWVHPNGHNRTMVILNVYIHIALQKGSSVAGLLILAWYVRSLPASRVQAGEAVNRKVQFWIIVGVTAMVTIIGAALVITRPISLITYIDIAISGTLLGLIFASFFSKTATS